MGGGALGLRPSGSASSTRRAIRAAWQALVELALPLACASCGRPIDAGERGIICGRCWARLALLPHPRCARCGHPTRGKACTWCAQLPPYVRAVRSVCWATSGAGQGIVHALKYGGWPAVASGMADRMARLDWPVDVVEERTALVPVPLAVSRLRQRGYNQSERLAQALAPSWGVPVWSSVLRRVRATSTQTRLSPDERARNVHGAFRADPAAGRQLRGAHIVLVDDVVTTAATLNACAAALHDGGARILSCITFARAPAAGDRL